ncbi:aldehyde ferredoxin oxidoreductase family protein [Chloroflexota bacterium]
MGQYGYSGKILSVDLSTGNITHTPTMSYADTFLGGRGIAAKIYWDGVSPDAKALDPENKLMFMTGPLAGFPGIGGSRWVVCSKSPLTIPEQFCYSNLGGSWGVQLKFAGYDGIVLQGKSDRPVYLSIQDDTVEIRDASALWGKSTIEVRDLLKEEFGRFASVVACGPAGENMVNFASILADDDASGSGGLGAVMGSKKLKAIVVKGSGRVAASNPEKLKELTKYVHELKREPSSTVMNVIAGWHTEKDVCYGCLGACSRTTYTAKDGTKGKFACNSAYFYQERARRYYEKWTEVPFYATRLCDAYGLDAVQISTLIMWLSRCSKAGILTDESTDIPLSKIGSLEFIETLVKKVSLRDGFGDILAQGLFRAADVVGRDSKELITDYATKEGHTPTYCPRLFISTGLLYAVEPRHPVQQLHEIGTVLFPWLGWVKGDKGSYLSSEVFRKIAKRFWGSELAADFATYEGKALAVTKIQDRQYAKECLVLCDWMWPIRHARYSEEYMGDPTIESKLLSAVTGREVSEQGLYRIGERVFNLQRAILAREGHQGRESDVLPEPFYTRPLRYDPASDTVNPDCLAPGNDGEIISKKGEVVDREKFERMKDQFYELRGWDVTTGLQTKAKLMEIGLNEISNDLEKRGLIS